MKKQSLLSLFFVSMFFISSVSFAQFRPPINGTVTLGTSSPSRLPDFQVQNCTLQARATNAGPIYVGSSIVTNLAGANPGISLAAGGSISNISVNNSNWIYLVADNANDRVTYLCN
jgi:hypothetical protein